MNSGDPTDHALATIASILDHPQAHRVPETAVAEAEEKPVDPALIEADGYHKVGPGPIAEIRFKWTVRRADDGEYYVDESMGENSKPVIIGPLTKEAAIKLVDDRQREARRRFELIKGEMSGRAATTNLLRKDGGES